MPDTEVPFVRLSRVTTRRGTLRQLNCPLEPELLVAEFSEELPPDVAIAVREHMAVCEICGKRAQELSLPYKLLSSLGSAPAPYVPDLRENVRLKAARTERFLRPLRTIGSLGRFGLILTVIIAVTIGALALGFSGLTHSFNIFTVQRTTNQLQHVPAAAPSGSLVMETAKLVMVTSSQGVNWQIAEVIVADQRTGQVTRSLPTSNASLRAASASNLPLAVATDGQVVYELTSPQNGGAQALVAVDLVTGATRFIARLSLPSGAPLPNGVTGVALALAPTGGSAYIGLSGANGVAPKPSALVISTISGKVDAAIVFYTPSQVPLPPPPGSLPSSAFPSVVPVISIDGLRMTEGAAGALVVSPDGQALFDSLLASDSHGGAYTIIRRYDLVSNTTTALGLQGAFGTERLAASSSTSSLQVYLVTGSPNAMVYVLDASSGGPTLMGQIALGGPVAPSGVSLRDSLSIIPAQNGSRLYVTQDSTSTDGVISAHNRWLVDTQGMGVLASEADPTAAGILLGNAAPQGKAFALINGRVSIGAPDLSAGWTPWLQSSDGTAVVRLIASLP